MKKLITPILFFAFFLSSQLAKATIWNVDVASFSFTPNSFPSVIVGDTVRWTESGGTHTTTSVSVPGGASTWSHNFTGIGDSFDYIVAVAGNYSYKCNFHGSMTGTFVASNPVSISENYANTLIKVYPNPTLGKLIIDNGKLKIEKVEVFNLLGEKVYQSTIEQFSNLTIDLSAQPDGVYFCSITKEDASIETKRIVKSK